MAKASLHWGTLLWLHITWSFICFAYFSRHVRSGHNQYRLFLDWPNEFWRHQSGDCDFSLGALSIGKYIAIGDNAGAMIALGESKARGSLLQFTG